MKKILLSTIFCFIISCLCFSQTVELAKLSAGKLINSASLYDNEKDDVYGYFYIFEKDKVAKKENSYEYVLLDKNFNKVCTGEFSQPKLYVGIGSGQDISFSSVYRNGFISIGIGWNNNTYNIFMMCAYRLLDVKENKLSDAFTLLPDMTKKYNPEEKTMGDLVSFFYYVNPFGYSLYAPILTNKEKGMTKFRIGSGNNSMNDIVSNMMIDANSRINKFYFVNEKLEPLWYYSYNEGKPNKNEYSYISFLNEYDKRNKNILMVFKSLRGKTNSKKIDKGERGNSYLFFNKNEGKLMAEISPFSKSSKEKGIKDVSVNSRFIDEAKQTVTFISRTVNSKKAIMDENLIQGFSKSVYSLTDGKEIKRDYFSWSQLSPYLNIDGNGYVKEKDDPDCYLYLHDVLMKDNENTIFILEEYKPIGNIFGRSFAGAKINDLFFMELDKDMKLVQFQRIDKENKTVRAGAKLSGSWVNYYGYFDYAGYQNLDGDNYLFFYYNKQKPEDGGKKQSVLGIISYIDGKFSEQKLPLKSEDGSNMSVSPAKKGYIMVYETFNDKDRGSELRLEKINY